LAAKKALWEYHLHGYHSPRAADALLTQTVEPPIAKPAGGTQLVVYTPPPPPPVYIVPLPAESRTSASQLPQVVAPPNGPRVAWLPRFGTLLSGPQIGQANGPRVAWLPLFGALLPGPQAATTRTLTGATPPLILNVTSEPPIAKPTAVAPLPSPTATFPTRTLALEPPAAPIEPPVPDSLPRLPPFMPDLPSVVLPPDSTPLDPKPAPGPPKIPATLSPLPR
jgi:hypothetical protein